MHPYQNDEDTPEQNDPQTPANEPPVDEHAQWRDDSDTRHQSNEDRLNRAELRLDQLCDTIFGNGVRPPLRERDPESTHVHYTRSELDEIEAKAQEPK